MAPHHWQWLGLSFLLVAALARDQATLSAAVGSEVIVETKAGSLAGKQMEEVVGCIRMADTALLCMQSPTRHSCLAMVAIVSYYNPVLRCVSHRCPSPWCCLQTYLASIRVEPRCCQLLLLASFYIHANRSYACQRVFKILGHDGCPTF
jgi:hypothetical protein